MKPKHIYLVLSVAGIVIPYLQFIPWLSTNGLNLRLFAEQMFANRISGFFAMDVIVSAIVVFSLARVERKRVAIRFWWVPLLGVLCVGVSFGLPLFLYLRELGLERAAANPDTRQAIT